MTSIVTGFTPIPERSDATPGLFNSRFQTLQDNIVSVTTDLLGWNKGSVSTHVVSTFSFVVPSIDSGGQVVNAYAYGATGDGTTNDVSALTTADAASGPLFLSNGTYRVNASVTLTSPVWFADRAVLKPASGVTITLANTAVAGQYQIFDLSLGGAISFSSLAVPGVYPAWWGAAGNLTADDTTALQQTTNAARRSGVWLFGGSGQYRITSTVSTQSDGVFGPVNQDWQSSTIFVDFTGAAGFGITGGAVLQRVKNLDIRPTVARQLAAGGTYVAANTGVRILNSRVDLHGVSQYFAGEGWLIESTAANSNDADYNLDGSNNGRGIRLTGTNDNMAVSRSRFRATGNSKEGVRVDDTAAFRQWAGFWYAEANWASDPNNAANYGIYIGKATDCELVIYAEQSGTASELYVHPTNAINCNINSLRRNKDIIAGTNQGRQGTYVYQTSDGASSRTALPIRLLSAGARIAQPNEYARMSFEAGDDTIGFIQGESKGVHLSSYTGNMLGVYDGYSYRGGEWAFAKTVALTSTSTTTTLNLLSLRSGSVGLARLTVAGSAVTNGMRIYGAEVTIRDNTLDQSSSTSLGPAASPPTVLLASSSASTMQLTLSYLSTVYGPAYTYKVSLVGGFSNVTVL